MVGYKYGGDNDCLRRSRSDILSGLKGPKLRTGHCWIKEEAGWPPDLY